MVADILEGVVFALMVLLMATPAYTVRQVDRLTSRGKLPSWIAQLPEGDAYAIGYVLHFGAFALPWVLSYGVYPLWWLIEPLPRVLIAVPAATFGWAAWQAYKRLPQYETAGAEV